VASLSQGRTAAAQCGLFTHKSVPVIFEPPCISCCTNLSASPCPSNYLMIKCKQPLKEFVFETITVISQ